MIAYLLQGAALGFSAAVSPGPFIAYLIAQAPLISDGPIIVLMLLVLTRFPDALLRVIQIAGALFVIYLAWKSFLAYRAFQPAQVTGGAEVRQSVFQAAAMNFLSPGPYIFWSSVSGPVLVQGWKESPAMAAAFLLGFYGLLVGGLVVLVVVFGTARRLGPAVNRAMLGISSLVLFAFGVIQLVRGILGN